MLVPKQLLSRPDYEPVTRVRLASHLRQIGVTEGGVLMVHVRLSAFGWVVGGMDSEDQYSVTAARGTALTATADAAQAAQMANAQALQLFDEPSTSSRASTSEALKPPTPLKPIRSR